MKQGRWHPRDHETQHQSNHRYTWPTEIDLNVSEFLQGAIAIISAVLLPGPLLFIFLIISVHILHHYKCIFIVKFSQSITCFLHISNGHESKHKCNSKIKICLKKYQNIKKNRPSIRSVFYLKWTLKICSIWLLVSEKQYIERFPLPASRQIRNTHNLLCGILVFLDSAAWKYINILRCGTIVPQEVQIYIFV